MSPSIAFAVAPFSGKYQNLKTSFLSFLGEMQHIAFRLMLSSCVCVFVCRVCEPHENGSKLLELTPDIIYEFYTNQITNSNMADKMAAVKHYIWP